LVGEVLAHDEVAARIQVPVPPVVQVLAGLAVGAGDGLERRDPFSRQKRAASRNRLVVVCRRVCTSEVGGCSKNCRRGVNR
jgi:hypothetical protein